MKALSHRYLPTLLVFLVVIAVALVAGGCGGSNKGATGKGSESAVTTGEAGKGAEQPESPESKEAESAQSKEENEPLQKVKIAYTSPSFTFLPLWVAEDQGFYRKYGLDVEMVMMKSQAAAAAINSGEIDFGTATTTAIHSAQQGLPVKVLMTTSRTPDFFLVTRPEIKKAEDLKGKVVGVRGLGGANNTALNFMLKKVGLDPKKDVTIIDAGDEATILEAMRTGKIAAGSLAPPWPVVAKKEGFNLLAKTVDALPDFPIGGIVASDRTIKERPELVKAVLRAQLDALETIHTNRAATVETIMKVLKLDKEVAEASYDLEMSMGIYTKDGKGSEEGIKVVMEINHEQANVPVVPVEQVANYSLLDEVLKERGNR